ncbi:MAG: hypothetical protein M1335_00875 [Chloroflexi bacterium]|nr:hypothetical protein [Chloroflexota bacterium]
MHKVTFFPLGNADCCRIDLSDGKGKKLLFDYADCRDPEDENDLRIDLPASLKDDLDATGRDYYDVVAFTHADDDHIHGMSEFFWLEHAEKYQGEGRIKIRELWVPAAVIIEKGLKDEAKILQAEARHRLINGRGIRIFSRPDRLKEWLEEHEIRPDDRWGLITDAGQVAPGLSKECDGIEFFVHSPFAVRAGEEIIDRNEAALVMQATFSDGGRETRMILGSDCEHESWCDIVKITRSHGRDERLKWDIFKISHHCSYTALSAEKGEEKTKPDAEVEWLFGQGGPCGVLVATCKPIPSDDADDQPPHRQAANYYRLFRVCSGLTPFSG